MWPFQDDEPAWVKARDERYRMIQELILENAPNIVKMPVGYYFVYGIPARTECRHTEMEYIFDNDKHYCMLEYTQHRLMVKCSWTGPVLGYQVVAASPRRLVDGFDFDHPKTNIDFDDLYWIDGQLEKWKVELSQQLPGFFEQLRADISYKLRRTKYEQDEENKQCRRSVDTSAGIIDCLRSKLLYQKT